MVSVAIQDSSSAPNAMLACGIAGFRTEVCLAREFIRLSRTCTIELRSVTVPHQPADSNLHLVHDIACTCPSLKVINPLSWANLGQM